MKKKKLNLKNEHIQKRLQEDQAIEKKDFSALLKKAIQPSSQKPA